MVQAAHERMSGGEYIVDTSTPSLAIKSANNEIKNTVARLNTRHDNDYGKTMGPQSRRHARQDAHLALALRAAQKDCVQMADLVAEQQRFYKTVSQSSDLGATAASKNALTDATLGASDEAKAAKSGPASFATAGASMRNTHIDLTEKSKYTVSYKTGRKVPLGASTVNKLVELNADSTMGAAIKNPSKPIQGAATDGVIGTDTLGDNTHRGTPGLAVGSKYATSNLDADEAFANNPF